ncbi:hypothetical protein HanIR_Chr05g0242821 [Helianthus annuus]|nr:hypothetical protein HanIR_Chr05g0242821 [Helianthus annuus]
MAHLWSLCPKFIKFDGRKEETKTVGDDHPQAIYIRRRKDQTHDGNHWGQVGSLEIKEFTGSTLRFLLFYIFLILLQ